MYNEQDDKDIKILEKYIDTEIYVPKIIHDEGLIRSMIIESGGGKKE